MANFKRITKKTTDAAFSDEIVIEVRRYMPKGKRFNVTVRSGFYPWNVIDSKNLTDSNGVRDFIKSIRQ
jgi:hypothetical protein